MFFVNLILFTKKLSFRISVIFSYQIFIPKRRYSDIIVHRQLIDILEKKEISWEKETMNEITRKSKDAKRKKGRLERESREYNLSRMLQLTGSKAGFQKKSLES